MLVTSIAAFERYHLGDAAANAGSAAVWERQALLRARPVAGTPELGDAFEALRRRILAEPLPEDLEQEIDRIRTRMQTELAREESGRRNLKTGRGGLVDVEMIVQLLQLRHGDAHPELLEPVRVDELLARAARLGLIGEEERIALEQGWAFLQRLSSRLRIVENRSISDLVEERGDLDSVARALGYPDSPRTGTARLPLLDDYRRHTETIRQTYRRFFPRSPS